MRPLSDKEREFVAQHLRLVDAHLRGRSYDDATYDDLRAAGYMGLCHAVTRYDPSIASWSTYAKRWIRKYMQMERQKMRIVSVARNHQEHRADDEIARRKRYTGHARHVMGAKFLTWDSSEARQSLAIMPREGLDEEDRRYIHGYLDELTPRQRMAVKRTIMNGERPADIARDVGLNDTRISQLRDRALVLLKARLIQERPELATADH